MKLEARTEIDFTPATRIDLTIDTDLARKILTGFLRTEIGRSGFSRAVIGLSGGIDSALACYLAAEALGPHNVLAVRMPYATSAPDSLEHAQLVIDELGVQSLDFSITGMVDPLFEGFPEMDRRRKGNAMARARMIVLYDQSVAFKGLVVGTGNKTEILLGYTTLYGDAAYALNPLGDLYKTQVRQLARDMALPEAIQSKPPSADLWVGQTDEGELGFTYEQVDRLLYLLIDQRYRPADCVEAGFPEAFVQGVVKMVRQNHFKRVMPPIAKLSNRTVGYDFLYLRDWGT
jgi:NAD+ synthase